MIQNNPLYDDLLKRGLEAIDAWHVFVAVKNGCQAFLTCDRLIHHYSASIRQICGLAWNSTHSESPDSEAPKGFIRLNNLAPIVTSYSVSKPQFTCVSSSVLSMHNLTD